jgi:hypothetical protein
MPYAATVHNVFIASPSDVRPEREIARQVIHEWNAAHAESEKAVLQPIGWETHSYPEMGERPQEIINRLVLKSDILVAVFWCRLGSPTGDAASGTIEEIEKHRKSKKPTMIYFSTAPVPNDVDTKQLEGVRALRQKYEPEGMLGTFRDSEDFRRTFAHDLQLSMVEYLKSQPSQDSSQSNSPANSLQPDLRFVIVQNQSFVGVTRRRDERQNAQISTEWNVTNASVSGLPVRLLRARLVKPPINDSPSHDVVLIAGETGGLYSPTHAISPGETRRASISIFCALPSEMLNRQIDLQIVAVDQLSNEHLTPSITLPILEPLLENLTRDRGSLQLRWTVYKNGYLLKCNHGYYFVYLQFDEEERVDRWFTEYEPDGHGVFSEHGSVTGNVHGFQTFEEARAHCEKDAEDVGRHLGLQG